MYLVWDLLDVFFTAEEAGPMGIVIEHSPQTVDPDDVLTKVVGSKANTSFF